MIKIGITQGDVNGIGYETILKTFSDARILEFCVPVIYGSSKIAAYHRKAMELPPLNINIINRADEAGNNRINIINCVNEDLKVELGKIDPLAGELAVTSLLKATEDLRSGKIDVLVMAPANPALMKSDKFPFPGEKEYFESLDPAAKWQGMTILAKNSFRIASVTERIPLSEVSSSLSIGLVVEKLKKLQTILTRDFTVTMPRLAVLSFNPSGSENSKEEKEIIIPAIEQAGKEGIFCFGPYAADELFGTGSYIKFDAVLAIHYEQALLPFKTLSCEEGACLISDLPHVVTSAVQNASYEIAGQNQASEASFRNALYLAIDVWNNRKIDHKINSNPLKKQYFERGSDNEKLDLTQDE